MSTNICLQIPAYKMCIICVGQEVHKNMLCVISNAYKMYKTHL